MSEKKSTESSAKNTARCTKMGQEILKVEREKTQCGRDLFVSVSSHKNV